MAGPISFSILISLSMKFVLYSCTTILLLTTILTSCTKEKASNLGLGATEEISSNIRVRFGEDPYNPDKKLAFIGKTEKNYPCSNYIIGYNLTTEQNTIKISFININKPGICATAFGPATCSIPVENISDGDYKVQFIVDGSLYEYNIRIQNGSYSVLSQPLSSGVIFE